MRLLSAIVFVTTLGAFFGLICPHRLCLSMNRPRSVGQSMSESEFPQFKTLDFGTKFNISSKNLRIYEIVAGGRAVC